MGLGGCRNGESFKSTEGILGQGWATPPEPYDPEPLYCYKTIGNVDCHRMPLQNGDSRLQGSYEGPKQSSEEVENGSGFFSFLKPSDPESLNAPIETMILPQPVLTPDQIGYKPVIEKPLPRLDNTSTGQPLKTSQQLPLSLKK